MSQFFHIPVLVRQALELFNLRPRMRIIDATVGLGSHAEQILEKIVPEGKLLGIDLDQDNLKIARQRLQKFGASFYFAHGNFSEIRKIAQEKDFCPCDGVLFDLGLASPHVDNAERGFSFRHDAPLDMRFDRSQSIDAASIVNSYSFDNLVQIFRSYGQEPQAYRIAQAIVTHRSKTPFTQTKELSDLIVTLKQRTLTARRKQKIHPATQVFQALRMEVNQELDNLKLGLEQAIDLLSPCARIIVISYHSLEDRIVKTTFRTHAHPCVCPLDVPFCQCGRKPALKIITKKAIRPSPEEVATNHRSRSAKLRVAEKLP